MNKYDDEHIVEKFLDNIGKEVKIVTYTSPDGEIVNVALENIETSTVIIDFDVED